MKKYLKSLVISFLVVLGIFLLYPIVVSAFFPGYSTEVPFWLMVLVVIAMLFFDQSPNFSKASEPQVSAWWYLLPLSCLISGFVLAVLTFEVLNIPIKQELFLFVGAGFLLAIPPILLLFWVVLPLLARRSTAAKKILDHNKIKNT